MNRNLRKQWIVTPDQLPAVIRRCPKCGKKTEFINSGKFRVNANGRLIDVWLIYRCGQCETSWNMTIWERAEAGRLEKEEYEGFLKNDPGLAEKYGNNRDLFTRNKAEVAVANVEYHVTAVDTAYPCGEANAMEIEIRIPPGFDLRADIFLMQQLPVSRSRIKKWCEDGFLLNGGQVLSPKEKIKDGMLLQIRKEACRQIQEEESKMIQYHIV